MAAMFAAPLQQRPLVMPATPPPDDSEERAAQREQARKQEVSAQKAMGRTSTRFAGTRIALAKQQAKAKGTDDETSASGLLVG